MNYNILLIDTDPIIHKVMERQIGKKYTLFHAHTSAEAFSLMEQESFSLIFLEAEMPEVGGHQICQQIRANPSFDKVFILLISSKCEQKDILLGYDMGADDYIIKPFHIDTFDEKASQYQKQGERSHENRSVNQLKVISKFDIASEFIEAMAFVESTYSTYCLKTLAEQFFNLTDSWGLDCCTMFSDLNGDYFYSNSDKVTLLEKQLLSQNKGDIKLLHFGCRTIVNYPQVSLLVRNMPHDVFEVYKHYQNLLPPILGAINAKVISIVERERICIQSDKLSHLFEEIRETVASLAIKLVDQSEDIKRHLTTFDKNFETEVEKLHLPKLAGIRIRLTVKILIKSLTGDSFCVETIVDSLNNVLLDLQHVVVQQQEFSYDVATGVKM